MSGMATPMPSERYCVICHEHGHYTDDCPGKLLWDKTVEVEIRVFVEHPDLGRVALVEETLGRIAPGDTVTWKYPHHGIRVKLS